MTERIAQHTETLAEEIANAVTHGVGAALAVAGLVVLLVLASLHGGALEIVSLAIYGATLVLTYVASTLLHAARSPRFKHACNLLDHASIYLLIAGTYTPFLLLGLRGAWGWALFAVIWALAVAGVVLRLAWRGYGRRVAVPLYLGMGLVVARRRRGRLDPGRRPGLHRRRRLLCLGPAALQPHGLAPVRAGRQRPAFRRDHDHRRAARLTISRVGVGLPSGRSSSRQAVFGDRR
jgi:hypothetical protein